MKQPKLYLITQKQQHEEGHGTVPSLLRACERSGILCEKIAATDTTLADIAGMQFEPGSLLYRVSTSTKAAIIESMLVSLHPGTFTTIYYPKMSIPLNRTYWELNVELENGLRTIPTLIVDETWQRMDTAMVNDRVAEVDGFPVVVKELGLSHGQGVRKLDTAENLQKLLHDMTFERYGTIIRKYLANYRHYRLIVIDGEVVAANEYHKPADDFRTNASESPEVSGLDVADIPGDIAKLAIDSVAIRQSIFGGVDILVDQDTQIGYLAEANVPCYYPRAEGATGIDISGKLLAALVRKREGGRA